jgi:hypothetical protein
MDWRIAMLAGDQVEELKAVFNDLSSCSEGGIEYVLIPKLKMPEGCTPQEVDALLCPTARGDGYESRLFFATKIECSRPLKKPLNWNGNVRVLEQNWYAYSYKVDAALRLKQMVAAHLGAFK